MKFGNFCKSYLWTLQNFSELGVTEKELEIPSVEFAGVRWLMKINICEICENGDFSIILSLVTETAGVHKPKIYWRISLMGKDGTRWRMKDCEMRCLKPESIEAFKVTINFLQRFDIQDLLPYDCLTICLDLVAIDMFTCQASWKSFEANELFEPDHCLKSLSRDFLALFQSEDQTDVVLHVGNRSFPAHKLILAARSKVFAKKFLHNAEEKSRYSIFIDDIESCDAKLMLEYIYSGSIPEMPIDRVYSLYSTAVKYEIVGLQRRCMQLISNISMDNVEHILDLDRQSSHACKKRTTNLSRDLPKKTSLKFLNKLIDYFIHGVLLLFLLYFSHLLSSYLEIF